MGIHSDKPWVEPTEESILRARTFDTNREQISEMLLTQPRFLEVLNDIAQIIVDNIHGYPCLDIRVTQLPHSCNYDWEHVYIEFTRKGKGRGKWKNPKYNNDVVAWKYNLKDNILTTEEIVGDCIQNPCRYMHLIRRINLKKQPFAFEVIL